MSPDASRLVFSGKPPQLVADDQKLSIKKVSAVPRKVATITSESGHIFSANQKGESHHIESTIVTTSPSKESFEISITYNYWPNEYRWVSGHLLFLRVWWARHWGADYIFDASSGKMIYGEQFADR